MSMTDTGVVRRLDELGRITLPMELRRALDLTDRDSLHIYVEGQRIVLEKYAPVDIFTGTREDLIEYNGKKVSKDTIRELARIANIKLAEQN